MKNSADQGECYPQRPKAPRWITPSEIWRILHILRKPNSIIALLFIQNISSFLNEFCHFALCFFRSPNIMQPCPQIFLVNSSTIYSGLHFRHHWFNMVKILSKFGERQLVMVNYACGFNQSEMGKYFEWIINKLKSPLKSIHVCNMYVHVCMYFTCTQRWQINWRLTTLLLCSICKTCQLLTIIN